MIRVLITGAESYIGISLERHLKMLPEAYTVDTVDMIGDSWKQKDFSGYDAVFHVAGIVHKKEKPSMKDLYFRVNTDLAYETASKAKDAGVGLFVFLSTMSVYGLEKGIIQSSTIARPTSYYGQSKLEAEEKIKSLGSEIFKVAIVRPPMVYGKGCKGNYPRLAELALKTPVFPDLDNKRSMIYIENLAEFARILIENPESKTFLPQNDEHVSTTEMVMLIRQSHGKKTYLTKIFNPLIRVLNFGVINKVFGSLTYEKDIGSQHENYNLVGFKESIDLTESEDNI
jgi:UDP-glucose 4-epimerase